MESAIPKLTPSGIIPMTKERAFFCLARIGRLFHAGLNSQYLYEPVAHKTHFPRFPKSDRLSIDLLPFV